MRYFWNSFTSILTLRLRDPKRWIVLLLLPLLIAAVLRFVPKEEVSAPVQVGVALPPHGGQAFFSRLTTRSGTVLTFLAADEETIDRNVASGRWDCGLVLADDFERQLTALDTDRLFTLKISSSSTVYPLVRETVFACLAEMLSPAVAEDFLLEKGIVSEATLETLHPHLEEILPDDQRVRVSLTTLNGQPLEPLTLADRGITAILRWLISAVLLVWLSLSATDLGRWMETPAARRARPLRSSTGLMVPRMLADGLMAFFSGFISLSLLGGIGSLSAMFSYTLFLCSLSLLLAKFRPVWTALPILMPFLPVISLILSPVLVDISGLFPALSGVVSRLPVALFLRACDGTLGANLPLLLISAISLLCCLLTDRIRKQ